jgi:hypothetical protein
MNLLILGEHSDDKGKQLEKLTTNILSHLGYKNIKTNIIRSGGQEIDVVATHEKPGLNGPDINDVLCECKAYRRAMSMGDWLKFLGKVFIHKTNVNISAYFIALNGVNGNVMGNYEDLRNSHRNIKLVTGEDLLISLKEIYKIITVEEIQTRIKNLTDKSPIEISLCYYNESVYFLFGFSDNTFSILNYTGNKLETKEADKISNLVSENTNYIEYLDLEAEKIAIHRKQRVKKYIVSILFSLNESISLKGLVTHLDKFSESFNDLNEKEIKQILEELEKEKHVIIIDQQYKLSFHNLKRKTGNKTLMFLRYLFSFELPLFVLESTYYDKLINETLLLEICKVQSNISLNKTEKKDFLELIKLSPTALNWSIYPEQMITLHRQKFETIDERLNRNDVDYLFQKAHKLLFEDFKNQAFHKYFSEYRGIVEIEATNNFSVKSNAKIELQLNSNERLQIGKMAEQFNNQLILIKLIKDTQQPWEHSKIKNSNN